MWTLSELTIDCLRVKSGRGAAPALRSAVGLQLGSADLRPAAMPPAAVLIVRRLADPLPGGVSGRPGTARADGGWERAVRTRLADLYARAAAPAAGPVPPDAEAVRFADEAEMLAHLALDLARGRHRSQWWWRAFLRLPQGDLVSLLVRYARSVPAAVASLAQRGEFSAVAAALSPADALRVVEALAAVHGLGRIALSSRGRATPAAFAAELRRRPPAAVALAPPWRPLLPGSEARKLTRECECLWGIALALYHQHARARSESFARAVEKWWRPAPPEAESRISSPPRDKEPEASPRDPHPQPPLPEGEGVDSIR